MFNESFGLKKTFAASYNPLCIGNPGPPKLNGTGKVVQLTGDTDRERNCKTSNQTATRYKIYGTDLGVSFYMMESYFSFLVILLGGVQMKDFHRQAYPVPILMKMKLIMMQLQYNK